MSKARPHARPTHATTRPPALAALVLALLCGLVAAGCGAEERPEREVREGSAVTVGGVRYVVPLSRQLNPLSARDRDFFEGVSVDLVEPGPEQLLWYGVFLDAEGAEEAEDRGAARPTFTLVDTQENVFRPVEYVEVRGDDAPGEALLLFRIPRDALANRPLELVISPRGGGRAATVTLDV